MFVFRVFAHEMCFLTKTPPCSLFGPLQLTGNDELIYTAKSLILTGVSLFPPRPEPFSLSIKVLLLLAKRREEVLNFPKLQGKIFFISKSCFYVTKREMVWSGSLLILL